MSLSHATTSAPGSRQRAQRSPDSFPGHPLDQLVEHLRRHPRVDAAAFTVLDAERTTLSPVVSWFASPVIAAGMEAVLERPYRPGSPGFAEAAIERGRPLFLPRLEDWEAAGRMREAFARAGSRLGEELWTAYVRASVIACPVRSPLGRAVGALEVASFDPARPLTRDDLSTIEVMADLAGLAHARAHWLEQETTRTRVELELKRAAEDVAASLETPEVLHHVVAHALRALDADRAQVSRTLPSGQLSPAAAAPEEARGEFEPGHLAEVARSGAPASHGGDRPSAHVPIALGPRLLGVLSVARTDGRPFGESEVEVLQRLARNSAPAIVNASLFEQERRLSRALTRGFVPDCLPDVDDYEVAALYEPAAGQAAGGDVYGVWTLPGGSLALLIGDVAGKGAATSGLSAMARFFVEARTWEDPHPAQALARAGAMLADRLPEDTFVTAFLAVVSEGEMRCANAGHSSPLVARARGGASDVPVRGLPLGIDPGARYEESRVALEPGDVLFAYTDGLSEARRDGQMFGAERLAAAIEAQRGEPGGVEALLEAVHETAREWAGSLSDDATSLAIRRK
jgi:GAF domain-containing protein